jgi:hypothetical protein
LVLIYFLIYIKYIGNLDEIFWKLLYLISISLILFIYFFSQDFLIWQYFFNLVHENLIIKDTQDLVNIAFDLSFIYTVYFITPLIGLYLGIYLTNYNLKEANQKFLLNFLCLFYYYILIKFLLDNDLFLANWEIFMRNQATNYDFQPDLIYLVLTYLGDFYDLVVFFFVYLVYLLNLHKLIRIQNKKGQNLIRILIHFLFSCFILYFFGGESGWIDLLLLSNSFIYLEFLYIIGLFFNRLKHKKYNFYK